MTTDQRQTLIDSGLKVAKELGVPVVMLAVVVYLFREAAMTVHTTVVTPVVESHTQFLETMQETMREMSHTDEKTADTLHEIAEGQQRIQRGVDTLTQRPPGG